MRGIMFEPDANDDDDDEFLGDTRTDRKRARRMAHTVAEQRRRDQIKVCRYCQYSKLKRHDKQYSDKV